MKVLKTKAIKVGGFDYEVEYVPNSFNFGALNRVGQCDFLNQKISINEHLHEDQQLEAFLHELVHAMIVTYDIPMPDDDESEEQIVVMFGKALLQVCKDNKLLNPALFVNTAPKAKKPVKV